MSDIGPKMADFISVHCSEKDCQPHMVRAPENGST